MTGGRNPRALLNAYAAEVERWNLQINLVSRRNSPARIGGLLQEACDAMEALLKFQPTDFSWRGIGAVDYFDLGSGAGFPGIPWHVLLENELGERLRRSVLVEPRQKRAWFLQRAIRYLKLDRVSVWSGRWGETGDSGHHGETAAELVLVSVKALRMNDEEVLAGWRQHRGPAIGGCTQALWICRFLPHGARSSKAHGLLPGAAAAPPGSGEPEMAWVDCGPPAQPTATMEVSRYRVN